VFQITYGKGFRVTFENGWAVSVQFGPGNYCDNYDASFAEETLCGKRGSTTAETAAINPQGDLVNLGDNTVAGHQTPAEVLALMVRVAALPSTATAL